MRSALAGLSLCTANTSNLDETLYMVLRTCASACSLGKGRPVIPCQALLPQLIAAVETIISSRFGGLCACVGKFLNTCCSDCQGGLGALGRAYGI